MGPNCGKRALAVCPYHGFEPYFPLQCICLKWGAKKKGKKRILFTTKATFFFHISVGCQGGALKGPQDYAIPLARKLLIGRLTLSKFFPANPLFNLYICEKGDIIF